MSLLLSTVLWTLIAIFLFYRFVFLRDNSNRIPSGENIVSPASGKIIHFEKIIPKNASLKIKKGFFGQISTDLDTSQPYYLVNIFLNVFDVHFTKSPCDATVTEVVHRPGTFRAVMSLDAGIENEKQEFLLSTKHGIIKIIQIAGLLARRCVNFAHVGDTVLKGAKLGQILLGSQVSLILPAEKWNPCIQKGQKVSAGETILFEPSK